LRVMTMIITMGITDVYKVWVEAALVSNGEDTPGARVPGNHAQDRRKE